MIQQKRFQYIATRARITFPLAIIMALLLWIVSWNHMIYESADYCIGNSFFLDYLPTGWIAEGLNLLFCTAIVYILIELNNAFSIIAHRTTFHTSVFVCLWASSSFLNNQLVVSIIVLCTMLALYYLFRSYQVYAPVGNTFHLFLFISLGSLLFPFMLFLIPLFYGTLFVFKALTVRSFFAGLVGCILPYWFLFAYAFYYDTMEVFYMPFRCLTTFSSVDYSIVSIEQWISLAYVLLIFVVSTVHFMLTSYQDKIRIRFYLYFLIILTISCLSFLLLQPQHFAILFALMLVGCCILSGHLFVLVNTKLSNIFFIVSIVLLLIITICNLWMPSYNFF